MDCGGNRTPARGRLELAEVRRALSHSWTSRGIGERARRTRHPLCDPQSLDSRSSAGARSAGLSAPDRESRGQYRLRARAGGAGVGTRARGPGADFASAPANPGVRCGMSSKRRKAELSFSGRAPATNDLIAGLNELAPTKQRDRCDGSIRSARANGWNFRSVFVPPISPTFGGSRNLFANGNPRAKLRGCRNSSNISITSRRPAGKSIWSRNRGDAVQLMTVHAAKGLEFEHVFVLRLTHRGFPMAPRAAVLEFPEALMKEELPRGDFHIQEERRLFYVAITRARERLTLTTVVHKRSRPSVFLEDILSAPHVAKQNVEQAAPVAPRRKRHADRRRRASCFFRTPEPRIYSRIARWAERYRPPVFEPLQLSASANRDVSEVSAEISLQQRLGHQERPERGNYFRQRDAQHDPPIYRRVAQGPAAQLRRSGGDFPARVDFGGFRRPPPGGALPERWHRAIAGLSYDQRSTPRPT